MEIWRFGTTEPTGDIPLISLATTHGNIVYLCGITADPANPGDIGFDVLLQPTSRDLGAWSFRAEAKKIGGKWKITTFYPVATFAPSKSRSSSTPNPSFTRWWNSSMARLSRS